MALSRFGSWRGAKITRFNWPAGRRVSRLHGDKHISSHKPIERQNGRTRGTSSRKRSTEDPLSKARRHAAEGEERVARQEILIAELDRDGHAKLAVTARVVLGTLEGRSDWRETTFR